MAHKKANLKSGGGVARSSDTRSKRPPGDSVGALGKATARAPRAPVSRAEAVKDAPFGKVTRARAAAVPPTAALSRARTDKRSSAADESRASADKQSSAANESRASTDKRSSAADESGASADKQSSAANESRARTGAKGASPSAASNRANVLATNKTRSTKHAELEGPSTRTVSSSVAQATFECLRTAYPDAHCELDHQEPFQLLVATVLSAQSTDVAVNRVTPALFKRWANARELAQAPLVDVESAISSLGMFRQKARHLVGLSKGLVEQHGGKVPHTLDALVALPGVGRKTANVVLGVAFGAPEGVVVDTHVQRLAQRLGWTTHDQAGPIEQDLMQLFPREQWDRLSHTLIFHGRRCCTARAPACAACPVNDSCPSAFAAEAVGRKNRPAR